MFAIILFIVAATLFRFMFPILGTAHAGWLANFSPLAAIALCGAIYLPRRWAIALPLAVLLASNLALNAYYHEPLFSGQMIFTYAAFGLIVALGFWIKSRRENPRVASIFGATLLGSFLFYFITNTGSWLSPENGYAHTLGGWLQALTTGLPAYEPTWMFFRNSAVSDLIFTAIFVSCFALAKKWTPLTAKSAALANETPNAANSQLR